MKPVFAASFALILWALPALAQTPDDFAACDADPWPCLAEAVALVEANGADIEDYQGVLAAYAGALARRGDTERAASLVAQLEMPRDIIFGELALAKALQSAGRGEAAAVSIGNAVLAMRQMENRSDKWIYWARIAGVQKEIGDMDAAKATLAPILAELAAMDGGRTRDALTIAVIASGALDSDIDVALALINDIRNLYSQAKPMNAYIRFLVRAGQPAQALEAAFGVDPPKIRTAVLAVLTEELTAVDEMELARRAADEAMNVLAVYDEGSSSYPTIIGDTARAMAWVDEDISFGLASLLMANELTPKVSPRKFVQIMLDVAEARRIIGQEAGALSALQSALKIASVSRDVGTRYNFQANILPALVRAGAFGLAFDTVQAETIVDFQALLLMVLADEMG